MLRFAAGRFARWWGVLRQWDRVTLVQISFWPMTKTANGVPTACAAVTSAGLLRKTTTTYKLEPYTTDALHMPSLPVSQKVFDGANAQTAQTDSEYDERPLLALETAGIGGFDLANYPVDPQPPPASQVPAVRKRGNLTAVLKYSASGVKLTSAYQYDSVGNLRRIAGPAIVAATAGYSATSSFKDDLNAGKLSYATPCNTGPGGVHLGFATNETLPPASAGGNGIHDEHGVGLLAWVAGQLYRYQRCSDEIPVWD